MFINISEKIPCKAPGSIEVILFLDNPKYETGTENESAPFVIERPIKFSLRSKRLSAVNEGI